MLGVSVIGGYLGAGKTTLVNHLLRHADGQRLAVLVNEFGALPIDEDLIEAQDDALISIAGGCVCCSYGNDLIEAMLDMSKMNPQPDHILIEASGVAMPDVIAAAISILDGFQIDGIVIAADAETIRDQAQNDYIGDTITRQLADADLVLLNKSDLVRQTALDDTTDWLATVAPNANVIPTRYGNVPNAIVVQQFPTEHGKPSGSLQSHTVSFDTDHLIFDTPVDGETIAKTLADPQFNLIRAKGFVPTNDGLRAVQIVGRRWAVSDAPDGATTGVVVIAEKGRLELDRLQAALAQQR